MKEKPRMISVMTPSPQCIEASELLSQAKLMMYTAGFRHLPVTDKGQIVGILSDRDIKLALAITREKSEKLLVSDACNFQPYTVEPDTLVEEVVANMAERRIGSALIAKNGKLVGIFTTVDVCRQYAHLLRIMFCDA